MRARTETPTRIRERGAMLMITLVVMVAVATFAATVTTLVSNTSESHVVRHTGDRAFYLAESGARYAINQLRQKGDEALDELTGHTFTLADGSSFHLEIQRTDGGIVWQYTIDSTGLLAGGGSSSGPLDDADRDSINGYYLETPKYKHTIDIPVPFYYALQVLGTSQVDLTGSSYIDSYDSDDENKQWTTPGGFRNGNVRVAGTSDAVRLASNAAIYGNISLPEDTDISDPNRIVNRPGNVYGDPGLVAVKDYPMMDAPPPPEETEATPPTSWDPCPSFNGSGSQTIDGGNYAVSGTFSPGNANVTATGNLALDIGKDLQLDKGSLMVDGSLAAWVAGDFKANGKDPGLEVDGNSDLQVGGGFSIGGSQTVTINGDLDLDVAGDFALSGDGTLHIKGDAYIDVAGGFSVSGNGTLAVDGKVILHVGDGFALNGNQYPVIYGENGSLWVYVDSGSISVNASDVNTDYDAPKFLVFGGENVSSVKLNGNAKVVGAFRAPAAKLSLNGNCELFGAAIVQSVGTISGNSCIHYDELLVRVTPHIRDDHNRLRRHWVTATTVAKSE